MVKTHHKNFNAAEFQLFFATLTPIPKSYVDFWENSDHVACINYSEKIAAHLPKLNLEQGSNIQRSGKDMTCNFNITLSDFVDIRFTPSANGNKIDNGFFAKTEGGSFFYYL